MTTNLHTSKEQESLLEDIIKVLENDKNAVLILGYGYNISDKGVKYAINARKDEPAPKKIPVSIMDHELRFSHDGTDEEPVSATIYPKVGSEVPAALYVLTPEHHEKMTMQEEMGATDENTAFRQKKVIIRYGKNKEYKLEANAYEMSNNNHEHYAPKIHYMISMINGRIEIGQGLEEIVELSKSASNHNSECKNPDEIYVWKHEYLDKYIEHLKSKKLYEGFRKNLKKLKDDNVLHKDFYHLAE